MLKFHSNRLPILLLVFVATKVVQSVDYEVPVDESPVRDMPLSLKSFQDLLHTEMSDELEAIAQEVLDIDDSDDRRLIQNKQRLHSLTEAQVIWEHVLDHGWHLSEKLFSSPKARKQRGLLSREETSDKTEASDMPTERSSDDASSDRTLHFPFLICSRTPLLHSGSQRLHPMLQFTGAEEKDTIVIANDDYQTCYHISTSHEKAKFLDTAITNEEYVIVPMADLMKISASTIKLVRGDAWSVPTPERRFQDIIKGEEKLFEWERILRVSLVDGRDKLSESGLMDKANYLLKKVMEMGQQASVLQRRRRSLAVNETLSDDPDALTITDAFSLTSALSVDTYDLRKRRALSTSRTDIFSRSLSRGLEAEHFCKEMFESLEVRPVIENNGFDIVLNPTAKSSQPHKLDEMADRSSACNPDCVTSLIMGLSVLPEILTIEADLPITPDDYESQWITQSNSPGKRPFSDSGLTGKNQVVSVVDSGLDISHKYFGPTSSGIHQQWVMSERKIVRYEHNRMGDRTEPYQGHGTRVAGVIAGSLVNGSQNAADGVAKDAKIHMWDIQKSGGGYSTPGADELFRAISKNGKGAKISNASWSAGYRPYSARCRIYDSSLSGTYDDILFVAAAGNNGNDIPGKVLNTIGEPSSCKNVLAVGASQSHGERIYPGDKGKDYLADFSSRGPTADGRMKPDVVAPGYMVLAPRAHAAANNKEETYETLGTSFSAPVVAGTAAIIRQYFEEGWFPCGSKGCGKPMNPSGALVKAVLMNGATDLKSVQKVPRGAITEQIRSYDNHQGMGLINLVASLPLKNANKINAVAVNKRTIRDGDTDTFVVRTKQCSTKDLSVTLSWYDPPGASNCANCLVNDLDLSVEKNSRKKYPNGRTSPDRKNNVERVRLQVGGSGEEYKIVVTAHNLATPTQKYSLVATGCFDVQKADQGMLSCGSG